MEVLSEHICEGWLEGYLLTGRHGLFATYEAFAMVVGLDDGAAHQVAGRGPSSCRWREPIAVAEHPADLDLLAQRPQRLQPPGAGPDRHRAVQEGHGGAHLPAARRQLPALGGRPLLPQPQLRQPDRHRQAAAAAVARHGRGHRALRARARRSGRGRATTTASEPDVVLACAGDIPTLEIVAAAWLLRQHVPEPEGARGQRRRPDDAVPARRPPARHGRDRLRRAVHRGQAGHLRLPRLPARDPPDHPRAGQRRALPRARLHRGGHHDHAVRHGRAERDEPLPPGEPGPEVGHAPAPAGPASAGRVALLHRQSRRLLAEHLEDPPEISNWTWT